MELQTLSHLATIAGTAFALIGGTWTFLFWRLERSLADDQSLPLYRERLRNPVFRRWYRRTLLRALKALRAFFGRRLIRSWRGYGACVGISLAYSVILFLAAWFIGGPGKLGNTAIFEEGLPLWRRAAALAMILAIAGFVFWWFLNVGKIFYRISSVVRRRVGGVFGGLLATGAGFGLQLLVLVVTGAAVSVAMGVVVAIFGAGAGPGTATVTITGAAVGGIAGSGAVAGGVGVAVVVAIAVAVFGVGFLMFGFVDLYFFAGHVLFWIVLPLVNGFWDWLSWGISRALGTWVLRRMRWRTLARHALLDLGAAVLLLAGLVVTLVAVIEVHNILAVQPDGRVPLELKNFLIDARADPWGAGGIWVTLMLLSTLVPTALHFVVLFVGGLTLASPYGLRMWLLRKIEGNPATVPAVHRHWAALYFSSVWVVGGLLVAVLFVLALWGIAAIAGPVSGMLYWLATETSALIR